MERKYKEKQKKKKNSYYIIQIINITFHPLISLTPISNSDFNLNL